MASRILGSQSAAFSRQTLACSLTYRDVPGSVALASFPSLAHSVTIVLTELVGLYVAPPFRRRGIGTALVRHVLAEARNNKVACYLGHPP